MFVELYITNFNDNIIIENCLKTILLNMAPTQFPKEMFENVNIDTDVKFRLQKRFYIMRQTKKDARHYT